MSLRYDSDARARATAENREKAIVGWVIVGLSAAVAVLLYVRDISEAILGCVGTASYGFTFIREARKALAQAKQEPKPSPPTR